MNNSKTIHNAKTNIRNLLILGGYGRAGIEITKLLLEHTNCMVTLAGRNKDKADRAVDELDNSRVKAIKLDAGDDEILTKTLLKFDLVIVCMPIASVGGNIVEAAIKAGIHYIDLNLNHDKHRILKESAETIKKSGLIFISESGFVPGLPAFLTRLLHQKLDILNEVEIAAIFREKEVTYGSCLDFVKELAADAYLFENGEWYKSSMWKRIKCKFGNILGVQPCYPMRMIEIENLAKQLELKKCGFYGAGINNKADMILFLWKIFKLYKPKWGVRKGAKLLYRAGNKNVKPPYITLIKATGKGHDKNGKKEVSILLSHADGYIGTAIPVVALIFQLLGGTINQPGVFAMGEVVKISPFVESITNLGLKLHISKNIS